MKRKKPTLSFPGLPYAHKKNFFWEMFVFVQNSVEKKSVCVHKVVLEMIMLVFSFSFDIYFLQKH